MLIESQLEEIREHLEKAQNPLFFYDNDADGFCSFLLLRRFCGKGKGVIVKSYPALNATYVRKIHDLKGDYIFVLDKALIGQDFLDEVLPLGIPIVWIDHHNVPGSDIVKEGVYTYNPSKSKDPSEEPTTYICYQVTKRKQDLWIMIMGSLADHYLPAEAKIFAKDNPELWAKGIKLPFDAYYKTEIGKLAQSIGFGIKDKLSNVVLMQQFFLNCDNPSNLTEEKKENEIFRNRNKELRAKYDSLLKEAKESLVGNLVFYQYGGDLSISSELSNELSFLYPKKYVAVAFVKGGIANVSLRGKGVAKILSKVLNNLEGASGGGHEDAVGSRIRAQDLEIFKEKLIKEIS